MTDEIKDLKDAEQAETERHDGPNMAWIPGLVLIGIGLVFLLNNFTDFELDVYKRQGQGRTFFPGTWNLEPSPFLTAARRRRAGRRRGRPDHWLGR